MQTDQAFPTKEAAEAHIKTNMEGQFLAFTGGVNIYSSSNGKCMAFKAKDQWHIHSWNDNIRL